MWSFTFSWNCSWLWKSEVWLLLLAFGRIWILCYRYLVGQLCHSLTHSMATCFFEVPATCIRTSAALQPIKRNMSSSLDVTATQLPSNAYLPTLVASWASSMKMLPTWNCWAMVLHKLMPSAANDGESKLSAATIGTQRCKYRSVPN
jgi:hypothetical protein